MINQTVKSGKAAGLVGAIIENTFLENMSLSGNVKSVLNAGLIGGSISGGAGSGLSLSANIFASQFDQFNENLKYKVQKTMSIDDFTSKVRSVSATGTVAAQNNAGGAFGRIKGTYFDTLSIEVNTDSLTNNDPEMATALGFVISQTVPFSCRTAGFSGQSYNSILKDVSINANLYSDYNANGFFGEMRNTHLKNTTAQGTLNMKGSALANVDPTYCPSLNSSLMVESVFPMTTDIPGAPDASPGGSSIDGSNSVNYTTSNNSIDFTYAGICTGVCRFSPAPTGGDSILPPVGQFTN